MGKVTKTAYSALQEAESGEEMKKTGHMETNDVTMLEENNA